MFSNAQVDNFVESLDLSYEWTNEGEGAKAIIVEKSIEYKPFSCKLRDLRNGKRYNSNTTKKFKELCEELAKK